MPGFKKRVAFSGGALSVSPFHLSSLRPVISPPFIFFFTPRYLRFHLPKGLG